MRLRYPSLWTLFALAAAVWPAMAAGAASAGPGPASRSSISPRADLLHPIDVKATLLDPVGRSRNLRVRVTVVSRVDLSAAEVRLTHAGGASTVGATRSALGKLRAGMPETADFTVLVPASGKRFLVQFKATGTGPLGPLSRGAVLNLLPDGPEDAGRVVSDPRTGARVHEYAARRIER